MTSSCLNSDLSQTLPIGPIVIKQVMKWAGVLNRVLDGAIGSAVESFATQKALEVQRRREEYLSCVAHDLRTPLGAIPLAKRVLELTVADPADKMDKVLSMLATIHRNWKNLEKLIGQVIEETTSVETEEGIKLERREFELWSMVESLVLDLYPAGSECSTRLTNAVPNAVVIYADANTLRRVFQNLIANAIDYSAGGEVVIGVCDEVDLGMQGCFFVTTEMA